MVCLLIVLYGIETIYGQDIIHIGISLLIVLYGIETVIAGKHDILRELLIVLYGIETSCLIRKQILRFPFNRTLWN